MAGSSSSLFVSTRRENINTLIVSLLLLVVVHLCITAKAVQVYTFEVVNEFPHDPTAFTQGLLYGGNDTLFESTGLYGESSVRKTDLHSGKIEVFHEMDETYFGEGLTLLDERLFQVTWLTTTGFVYDRHNLSKLERFTHEMTDGWGLATDGEVLFGTDGTSTLYKLSPLTFKVLEKATITYKDQEVQNLNELEYVNGEVWANVWLTDCIVRISPKDGVVVGWILLPSLREQLYQDGYTDIDVLNGIAWDSKKNRLFVTGKLWPKLYEINIHPVSYPFYESIEQLCLQSPALHFAEQGRGRQVRGRGGGNSAGRGQYSNIIVANAASVPQNTPPPSSSGYTSADDIPGFIADQVQRLLSLIEPSASSEKLFGPHFEEGDWTG